MTKRRSHYTPRIAADICVKIAMGATLKEALAETGTLAPTIETCWRWLDEIPEFKEQYERARQMQADIHADEMLQMSRDVIKTPSKAAAIKVACDILKWQAEIRNSKKYGSKVQHELTKPVMSPEDLRAEIKALEAELGVKAVPGMNTAPVFTRKTEEELATGSAGSVAGGFPAPTPNPEPEPTDLSSKHGDIHTNFDAESPPWVQ